MSHAEPWWVVQKRSPLPDFLALIEAVFLSGSPASKPSPLISASIEEAERSVAGGLKRGSAKMASNKVKTHMAALPVNVPPETNGGRLASRRIPRTCERCWKRAPPLSILVGSNIRRDTNKVVRPKLPSAKVMVAKN